MTTTYRPYNGPWLKQWLTIGRRNRWIREAADPRFTARSFHECRSSRELFNKFQHGNWCLGTAFVLDEVCFINQVEGGDEFLTIRRGVAFESMTTTACFSTPDDIARFCRAVTEVDDDDLCAFNYSWRAE